MRLCLFVLWMWLPLAAQATLLTPESREVNLLASAQFLEDPSGQLDLHQVQALGQRFRPWTGGGTEMNFGFTASAYWIRVPLQRTDGAAPQWLLELPYAKLKELDFHPPNAQPVITGSSRAFAGRPYFDRFFVFPVQVETEKAYFYLRATSRYSLTVPVKAWEPDAFRKKQQVFQALQFLYYGGLLVLAIFGLASYVAIKDRRFLLFSAYVLTAGLGVFSSNGFGRQFIWPNAAGFDEITQSGFLSLAAYFAAAFAQKLLKVHGSWLATALQLVQKLFLLCFALVVLQPLLPGLLRPANQLLMLSSLVMSCLVTIAGVQAHLKQQDGVRFFLAGWVVLWVGVCVAALRAFGVVPSNGLTSYAIQFATAVEIAFLALALGDILRIEQRAHMAVQQHALSAQRALLELTQASEEKLKKAVQERTAQLENLLQVEKSLREQYVRFGSMISHEFRTPLNIIQSQASLIRKEREQGIDQIAKRLEAIRSASKRLTMMFDKWLHNDSLNETLEVMELKPLDLSAWLDKVVETHPHLLLTHRIELNLATGIGAVAVDDYHLGLAVTNLIDNAAKYSPIDSTILLETRVKPGHVGIVVTDQGTGIPAQVHEKVFDEFFRFAPESQIQGVGLGLSIVKRIAQAHGGHVALSSEPGQGSSFFLWLPLPSSTENA